MLKVIATILLLFLYISQAWGVITIRRISVAPTPTAYFKLNAAGGTGTEQLYDEIDESWVGEGADNMTFVTGTDGNAVHADDTTDLVTIPGSYINIPSSDVLTITLDSKGSSQASQLLALQYSSGGDSFKFQPHYGSIVFRANYGSTKTYNWTSKPTNDTWYTYTIIIDVSEATGNITVYQDTTKVVDQDSTDIVDWGNLTGDAWVARTTDASYSFSIDELRTYDEEVTP